ncbi:hypothetical protein JJD41_10295 [Oxynema sp. CENA135]|uniref:hypothetical protein n=1 Tax=Oxynema sp. CENA135 TaxID=984206 RepID=UPI00190AFA66|nr:hypothetical protein [Oxynema sp. CENA135]MBK4730248.1 hypothetical protein [Oxynema sp. CENA135]
MNRESSPFERRNCQERYHATPQIRTIADEIRHATATTEMAMNEGSQTLDEALTVLDHTIASFKEVDRTTMENVQGIGQIKEGVQQIKSRSP